MSARHPAERKKVMNSTTTHELAPPDLACLLCSHRRISDEQKADIIEMQIPGVRKHQIMNILEMQYGAASLISGRL